MNYIYKFTNKINGHCYIGQTNNLQKRYNGHKSESFNPKVNGYWLPLHCAIRKYGIENFSYEIIEEIVDGESQQFIDEREKYFIQYYHSLIDENGYNVTIGGEGCPKPPLSYEEKLERSKLFTGEEIKDIQQRLINDEEYDDIEKIYAPKLKRTFLVNINTGTNFYNPDFNYPLKKNAKSKFSQKEIREIKNRIKSGEIYSSIQKDFNIKSAGFLSMINTGKYFYSDEDTYPLCNKGCRKQDNEEWVNGIIFDIINSNLSLSQIAGKWNKSYSTVKNINAGRSHKKEELKYPLR
ncbi:MAG: GIY-YIG nuclease family protein [Bacilli bacterium]|nr:GIY-YIG nuclease family protein [Bacilli bacterium]